MIQSVNRCTGLIRFQKIGPNCNIGVDLFFLNTFKFQFSNCVLPNCSSYLPLIHPVSFLTSRDSVSFCTYGFRMKANNLSTTRGMVNLKIGS